MAAAYLSVVIITHNEAKNIARCMESVQGVADEVIVMDSFSSDNTPSIVKEKGGILHQQKFAGYGAQKNDASALASGDFILFLDADELLSEDLKQNILRQKTSGFPFDGYTMNRLNNYCGQWIRHGSWYPDNKLRLINKKKGYWSADHVHEHIIMSGTCEISQLKGDLMHYAYSSVSEHMFKNNNYSELAAQRLLQKGRRSNMFTLIVNPFWAFMHSYFIKLGFLDGTNGFIIAINIFHLTFLKYAKLYQMQKLKNNSKK